MLVSGSGSNLQALIDSVGRDGGFEIAVVVSDRPGIRALARAEAAGIPAVVIPWNGDREAFTAGICDEVDRYRAEALVLAGFMRILAPEAVRRFPERILNVHPSLLPAFPGADAVPQAIAHGVKVSGVTVHFVDEQVDHGSIIAQQAVPVAPDDTEESLHARIQEVEHRLYPLVVKAFAQGRLSRQGRTVVWT